MRFGKLVKTKLVDYRTFFRALAIFSLINNDAVSCETLMLMRINWSLLLLHTFVCYKYKLFLGIPVNGEIYYNVFFMGNFNLKHGYDQNSNNFASTIGFQMHWSLEIRRKFIIRSDDLSIGTTVASDWQFDIYDRSCQFLILRWHLVKQEGRQFWKIKIKLNWKTKL